jgi:hypothetical protein
VLAPLSLVAGVGFALKPFFFIPWLVTQIAVTRKDWSRRNISLIVLTALPMAIQLVTIPIVFPDLVQLYQSLGHEYSAYWRLPAHLIVVYKLHLLAFALVLIGAAALVEPSRKLLVRSLAWVCLAWFVTGIVQGKGWSYHFLPTHMTLILTGLFALLCFDGWRHKSALRGMILACMVLVGLAEIQSGIGRIDYSFRRWQLPAAVRELPDAMRALVFSADMITTYSLLNELGARNVGSFPSVWPLLVEYGQAGLPGQLVPVRLPEEMTEPESILYEAVVADLIRKKPELILVSDGYDPVFNDAYFDYVAYFSQDEAFRQRLTHYVRGPRLGHVQLYIRTDIER